MQVWKYALPLEEDNPEQTMPRGARLLTVQMQRDTPCLWALVDPLQPPVPRAFHWIGTGWALPDALAGCAYVGTVQLHDGELVFHLFAEPEG